MSIVEPTATVPPAWRSLLIASALVLLLAATGAFDAWHLARVESSGEAVAHSYEVRAELSRLLGTLVDAETGQRGYLLTGNDRYLEPYRAARTEIRQRQERLTALTAGNPDDRQDLATMSSLIADKLTELERTIELRRHDGLNAAQQVVLSDEGKRVMDALRAVVARLTAREQSRLAARLDAAARSSRAANLSAAASTAFAIAAVGVIWAGFRRSALERARAAAAIAREREQLQVTLLGIGDGVIAVDANARVTFLNPVAEVLTGWGQAQAIGRSVSEVFRIVNEDSRHPVRNPLDLVLTTGKRQGLANHTLLIAADGIERPIDDSAAPLRNPDGTLLGGVLVFRDVSARRHDEQQLLQALADAQHSEALAEGRRRELEDALQIKNQFLAAVSHELRTPITSIVGWADMLKRRMLPTERVDAAIASIDRSARSLAQLIEDLLDSSHLLTGRVRLARESIDLSAVVSDAVDAVRLSAENKGVTLDVSLKASPVRGDRDRLMQVLWNLLGNAIKFTPPGGQVQVRLEPRRDAVTIAIRDTGAGISPALLPHVFEPFRQGENRSVSGLGLGLAIARQIVELHGGTIVADSEGVGTGATFTVRLPSAEAEGRPTADRSSSEAGQLVADDRA